MKIKESAGTFFVVAGMTLGVFAPPAIFAPEARAAEVQEDDPEWDCRTMGMRDCGPTNSQGVEAGCYSDTGSLVAPWPCHVVVNPDGSADVYEGAR